MSGSKLCCILPLLLKWEHWNPSPCPSMTAYWYSSETDLCFLYFTTVSNIPIICIFQMPPYLPLRQLQTNSTTPIRVKVTKVESKGWQTYSSNGQTKTKLVLMLADGTNYCKAIVYNRAYEPLLHRSSTPNAGNLEVGPELSITRPELIL